MYVRFRSIVGATYPGNRREKKYLSLCAIHSGCIPANKVCQVEFGYFYLLFLLQVTWAFWDGRLLKRISKPTGRDFDRTPTMYRGMVRLCDYGDLQLAFN